MVLAGPALLLIAGGFVKKTVVADELARRIVDPVFNDPLGRSGPEVLLAIYGFAGQIYCDFSGYTDMAIGLALLLGFKLPQNFNRPYTADQPAPVLAALAHRRCRAGCATTCTSRSAATAAGRGAPTAT